MQEPSAYLTTPRSSDTGRNWSGARRLGRMGNPFEIERKFVRGACRRGSGQRQGLLALIRVNRGLAPNLYPFVLTRFLPANRRRLRGKTLICTLVIGPPD